MIENQLFCLRGHLKSPENTFGKNQCKPCHKNACAKIEVTPKIKKYRKDYQKTEKALIYKKNYYKQNKGQFYFNHIKTRYGLSKEQYLELVQKQEGRCAICSIPENETSKGLVVDHCHKTKIVRGLLCNICNSHIVHVLEKYPHLIEPAKTYLNRGDF